MELFCLPTTMDIHYLKNEILSPQKNLSMELSFAAEAVQL